MTEPLHVAMDVRAGRTVLATVQRDRVIDLRRLEHGPDVHADVLADGVAVLRGRAPGVVAGIAGIWRHRDRLGVADAQPFAALLADVGARAGLPTWWLPHGAALAWGESLRAPVAGPLAVFALDVTAAGGVICAGRAFDPLRLDLGHLSVRADGLKCSCGARGCVHAYASETALQELARDIDLSLEAPSAIDWQTLMDSHLSGFQSESPQETKLLARRAGWAVGIAASQLVDAFGVVEVRVRTRHPDQWRVLAPAAQTAVDQVCGPRAPKLAAADAGEDAFFTGAVAAGR